MPLRKPEAIVTPFLTHIVTHHGRQTLLPPDNQGRTRKPNERQWDNESTRSEPVSGANVSASVGLNGTLVTSPGAETTSTATLAAIATTATPSSTARQKRREATAQSRSRAQEQRAAAARAREEEEPRFNTGSPRSLKAYGRSVSGKRSVRAGGSGRSKDIGGVDSDGIPNYPPPSFLEAISTPPLSTVSPPLSPPTPGSSLSNDLHRGTPQEHQTTYPVRQIRPGAAVSTTSLPILSSPSAATSTLPSSATLVSSASGPSSTFVWHDQSPRPNPPPIVTSQLNEYPFTESPPPSGGSGQDLIPAVHAAADAPEQNGILPAVAGDFAPSSFAHSNAAGTETSFIGTTASQVRAEGSGSDRDRSSLEIIEMDPSEAGREGEHNLRLTLRGRVKRGKFCIGERNGSSPVLNRLLDEHSQKHQRNISDASSAKAASICFPTTPNKKGKEKDGRGRGILDSGSEDEGANFMSNTPASMKRRHLSPFRLSPSNPLRDRSMTSLPSPSPLSNAFFRSTSSLHRHKGANTPSPPTKTDVKKRFPNSKGKEKETLDSWEMVEELEDIDTSSPENITQPPYPEPGSQKSLPSSPTKLGLLVPNILKKSSITGRKARNAMGPVSPSVSLINIPSTRNTSDGASIVSSLSPTTFRTPSDREKKLFPLTVSSPPTMNLLGRSFKRPPLVHQSGAASSASLIDSTSAASMTVPAGGEMETMEVPVSPAVSEYDNKSWISSYSTRSTSDSDGSDSTAATPTTTNYPSLSDISTDSATASMGRLGEFEGVIGRAMSPHPRSATPGASSAASVTPPPRCTTPGAASVLSMTLPLRDGTSNALSNEISTNMTQRSDKTITPPTRCATPGASSVLSASLPLRSASPGALSVLSSSTSPRSFSPGLSIELTSSPPGSLAASVKHVPTFIRGHGHSLSEGTISSFQTALETPLSPSPSHLPFSGHNSPLVKGKVLSDIHGGGDDYGDFGRDDDGTSGYVMAGGMTSSGYVHNRQQVQQPQPQRIHQIVRPQAMPAHYHSHLGSFPKPKSPPFMVPMPDVRPLTPTTFPPPSPSSSLSPGRIPSPAPSLPIPARAPSVQHSAVATLGGRGKHSLKRQKTFSLPAKARPPQIHTLSPLARLDSNSTNMIGHSVRDAGTIQLSPTSSSAGTHHYPGRPLPAPPGRLPLGVCCAAAAAAANHNSHLGSPKTPVGSMILQQQLQRLEAKPVPEGLLIDLTDNDGGDEGLEEGKGEEDYSDSEDEDDMWQRPMPGGLGGGSEKVKGKQQAAGKGKQKEEEELIKFDVDTPLRASTPLASEPKQMPTTGPSFSENRLHTLIQAQAQVQAPIPSLRDVQVYDYTSSSADARLMENYVDPSSTMMKAGSSLETRLSFAALHTQINTVTQSQPRVQPPRTLELSAPTLRRITLQPQRQTSPQLEAAQTFTRSTPTTQTQTQTARFSEITDLDVLVSRIGDDRSGVDYDALLLVQEFVGPAHNAPPVPRPSPVELLRQSTSLFGKVEIKRKRVTPEGVVKVKLQLLGNSVDKCGICLSQFKQGQSAGLGSKCLHPFHEKCLERWFSTNTKMTCPTCRSSLAS